MDVPETSEPDVEELSDSEVLEVWLSAILSKAEKSNDETRLVEYQTVSTLCE